jgi:HEAT repeat protein
VTTRRGPTIALLVSALALCAALLPGQERGAASRPAEVVALENLLGVLAEAPAEERASALVAVLQALQIATSAAETASAPASRVEARRRLAREAIRAVEAQVPLVARSLVDHDPDSRRFAANILDLLGTACDLASPALLLAITDGDERVRDAASSALAVAGADAADVPALVAELASQDANVRQNVAWTLNRMGRKAKAAEPALVRTLRDPREATRVNAAGALGEIGADSAAAIDALVETVAAEPAPLVRANAIWSIRCVLSMLERESLAGAPTYEALAQRLVPVLTAALEDSHPKLREQAGWALGKISDRGKPALPALVRALPSASGETRRAIVWALAKIEPETGDATAPLAAALSDPHPDTRQDAAWALQKLGPKARPAVPELIRALGDERKATRVNAAGALALVGADARAAAPALLRGLDVDDPDILGPFADALAAVAPDTLEALSILEGRLTSTKDDTRAAAAEALGAWGPVAFRVLPALAAIVESDRSPVAARAAAAALFLIDGTGDVAIPAVCQLLEKRALDFDEEIGNAIAGYGRRAAPHGPRLARLLVKMGSPQLQHVLLGLGLEPKDLVPALEALAARRPADEEEPALRIFRDVDPAGGVAIPALIRLLRCPVRRLIRIGAAAELAEFGPKARNAVPALRDAFEAEIAGLMPGDRTPPDGQPERIDPDPFAWALAAIGPSARPVLPSVVDRLWSAPIDARASLLMPLVLLDPSGTTVAGPIASQLVVQDARLQAAALEALAALGPAAASTLPALERAALAVTPELKPRVLRTREAVAAASRPESRAAVAASIPLEIEVDPDLALPADAFLKADAWNPRVSAGGDGGFRISLATLDSTARIELSLGRGPGGRPSAWVLEPTAIESGTLTLASAEWGSGAPILGVIVLRRGEAFWRGAFRVRDPF